MKIIDKTSQQDANGNISFVARVQGTLKYGLNWFSELEAQKAVITQFDRALEKGFVLIRNFTLPNSEIVIPIILIGVGGIWVIYVTNVKGNFEAKGDQWNTVNNDGKTSPASVNYISRVVQLGTVFQKYLKIQKIDMPNPVEVVLVASDPGAQIDSVRPAARVVRSDAIKQFASSLLQVRPIWRPDFIYELADRITGVLPPQDLQPLSSEPVPQRSDDAYGQENPFGADELGFAFDEGESESAMGDQASNVFKGARPQPPVMQSPASQSPAKKKFLGLGDTQIILLAGMLIVELCILFGFGILIYLNL
jgi:hypothetical protein